MAYPIVWQIEDIYFPLISAIGVPVNLVAIMILSRRTCGLSKCVTHYLVGMAVADLLIVVFDAILWCTVPIYLPHSFLNITPLCSLYVTLGSAATVVSVWLTVTFTADRFVAICCEKLKTKFCTGRTAAAFLGTVSVLGSLESIPRFFIYEPKYITHKIPWGCSPKRSFFSSSAWATFELINYIITPCLPFFLILLFNVLTVRRILVSSRIRKGLHVCRNGDKHKDTEMEKRRKSIVLLFSISGSFVLLWVTQVVYNIYARITDIQYYSSYSDPCFITDRTGKMLQVLSSCTNTFIYTVIQDKFRDELKQSMKRIIKSCNRLKGLKTEN